MHRSRALFGGSDALCCMRWSADFITNMSESEFSAHTGRVVEFMQNTSQPLAARGASRRARAQLLRFLETIFDASNQGKVASSRYCVLVTSQRSHCSANFSE
jgi:hypothetical protein